MVKPREPVLRGVLMFDRGRGAPGLGTRPLRASPGGLNFAAAAQDPEIKRAAADALISALAPRLARLALAHDPAGRTRLLREGVPSLCQASEPVTRNKGEKVRAMLAA